MPVKLPDSYLKNGPSSTNFSDITARVRMKGFHRDPNGSELDAVAVYPVNPNVNPMENYMPCRTVPGGIPTFNAAIGGIGATGRSLAVPLGQRWQLLGVISETTATATVGNRILQMRVRSQGGNPMWIGSASAAVTAAQVGGYDVSFGSPINTPSTTARRNIANTGNTNVQVREAAPALQLVAGDDIVITDSAGIDVADGVILYASYIRTDP